MASDITPEAARAWLDGDSAALDGVSFDAMTRAYVEAVDELKAVAGCRQLEAENHALRAGVGRLRAERDRLRGLWDPSVGRGRTVPEGWRYDGTTWERRSGNVCLMAWRDDTDEAGPYMGIVRYHDDHTTDVWVSGCESFHEAMEAADKALGGDDG